MGEPERRKVEWVKVIVELAVIILTNVVILVGAYYKLDTRMAVAESRIQQETKGYETLLASFNARMDNLEKKIDCLATSKFCH